MDILKKHAKSPHLIVTLGLQVISSHKTKIYDVELIVKLNQLPGTSLYRDFRYLIITTPITKLLLLYLPYPSKREHTLCTGQASVLLVYDLIALTGLRKFELVGDLSIWYIREVIQQQHPHLIDEKYLEQYATQTCLQEGEWEESLSNLCLKGDSAASGTGEDGNSRCRSS